MTENKQRFLALRKQYIESAFGRLNPVQKQAVFTTDGPLLILAGAGSGKTTVLVNRIANLVRFGNAYNTDNLWREPSNDEIAELEAIIKSGELPTTELSRILADNAVKPWNVLAITFTNKAAGELKNRLCSILGETIGSDINASTFHSMCVRILRREAEHLGYPKAFTIYDSDDQSRSIKEIYKQLSIDDKFLPVKNAISAMGRLKDKMITPQDALAVGGESRAGLVAKIYEAYQKKLFSAGAMDFDDLIYNTVRLLANNEDVRDYYQNRFKYVLVDEYQDTSIAQFRLVSLLTGAAQNICVVGDDDQSIYRFRGATIENILSFEHSFAGAQVIRLEENYRSTTNILNAANCVIKNNLGRKGKTLWTKNQDGEKIEHYIAENEHEEAAHIAQKIGENLKNGVKLRNHAILYRMNAQSGPIETYFARSGIPYKIIGGHRFFDRKEVKDIIAYLSVVANRRDDLRLKRIINEPNRKIGAAKIDALLSVARDQEMCILDVLANIQSFPELAKSAPPLMAFYNLYLTLCKKAAELPMDLFVAELIEITGYRQMLVDLKEEGTTRLENIGQLISSVKTYADQRGAEASLFGYLEEVALISDLDTYDEDVDVVVMMTMHSAKGLEYDYVFIVGLEEGIFPSEMSRFSDDDLEEERRLCYVGLTRAKKELYLSSAASRMIFGQTKRNKPSRFVEEIDAEIIDAKTSSLLSSRLQSSTGDGGSSPWGMPQSRRAMPSYKTPTVGMPTVGMPVKQSTLTFAIGDLVDHKVFGRGEVLKVTPVAGDTIVEIRFDTAGLKKTMANYAPLSLVK